MYHKKSEDYEEKLLKQPEDYEERGCDKLKSKAHTEETERGTNAQGAGGQRTQKGEQQLGPHSKNQKIQKGSGSRLLPDDFTKDRRRADGRNTAQPERAQQLKTIQRKDETAEKNSGETTGTGQPPKERQDKRSPDNAP